MTTQAWSVLYFMIRIILLYTFSEVYDISLNNSKNDIIFSLHSIEWGSYRNWEWGLVRAMDVLTAVKPR